jgi:hypothetical protein
LIAAAGSAKNAPLMSFTRPLKAAPRWVGAVVVGSGKFGTPCARMHLAHVRAWAIAAADDDREGANAPGNRFWHADWAALNAGESGLTPGMSLRTTRVWGPETCAWKGPEALGSGKFGTPCDRMQRENGTPLVARPGVLLLVVLGLPEPPQAAITSTPETTRTAIGRRRRTPFDGTGIPGRLPDRRKRVFPITDRRGEAPSEAHLQDEFVREALLREQACIRRMSLSRIHVRIGSRFISVWWLLPGFVLFCVPARPGMAALPRPHPHGPRADRQGRRDHSQPQIPA